MLTQQNEVLRGFHVPTVTNEVKAGKQLKIIEINRRKNGLSKIS
jgi:hypothetical protein